MNSNDETIFNVNEIFRSIQGEGSRAGLPCVFVRFQGCPLRCAWCDSQYALDAKIQKMSMTESEIIEEIEKFGLPFVTLTGGEPLYQKGTAALASKLVDLGREVAIETNGAEDVSVLRPEVIKIIDFKCPSSKMDKFNNFKNVEYLTKNDEVKFVVSNLEDYLWAKSVAEKYDLFSRAGEVLISPVWNAIDLKILAERILMDKLNFRLQIQLHKIIWGAEATGV